MLTWVHILPFGEVRDTPIKKRAAKVLNEFSALPPSAAWRIHGSRIAKVRGLALREQRAGVVIRKAVAASGERARPQLRAGGTTNHAQ
jgi:hypothetical protein